jgi:ubiquitin-like 1-activating enzyme E1 B
LRQIAKETASAFNPRAKIVAHHANIKDAKFSVSYFSQFDIVFNALDNMDARRHVNRMCLFAGVPLIESGTTGFHGQVQVIKKGEYQCYDCLYKEPPKSFPVCTIRSTPSQSIHCIVWAKSYLFTEIFGTSEDEMPELDMAEDVQNAQEMAELRRETNELSKIRESMGSKEFTKAVFDKVFNHDVVRLRSMEDAWKNRKPPEPLEYEKLADAAKDLNATLAAASDQIVWTTEQNFAVFADSLERLSNRIVSLRTKTNGSSAPAILTFDKDDTDILDFVAASANLRSSIFSIPMKSKFDIKRK